MTTGERVLTQRELNRALLARQQPRRRHRCASRRYEKGRIELGPFRRLDRATQVSPRKEAARLAEFRR